MRSRTMDWTLFLFTLPTFRKPQKTSPLTQEFEGSRIATGHRMPQNESLFNTVIHSVNKRHVCSPAHPCFLSTAT